MTTRAVRFAFIVMRLLQQLSLAAAEPLPTAVKTLVRWNSHQLKRLLKP
jgi:hypothetical protein